MLFSYCREKVYSVVQYIYRVSGLEYLKKLGNNLMPSQSFGVIYLMGSVLARIKVFIDNLGHKEATKRSKEAESHPNMKEGIEEGTEVSQGKEIKNEGVSREEAEKANEKVAFLEEQLSTQKSIMDEHQEKIHLLEDLIKRQCLLLKENDDTFITYEQLAKSAPQESKESVNLWERIESLLNSMIEKKEGKEGNNPQALMRIKREFEAQRLQLEQHDQSIKRHEEDLEEQLAKIETMREILDENSNHTGYGVKTILEDHEKRLTALENRMALYEKQVEKRLLEQHQLLVFTWIGLITTFVLCFAIVCSCCWFR